MCVGKKIKSYLENNGITQTFVANKTGIPVQKLNLSLNGNRRLKKLSNLYLQSYVLYEVEQLIRYTEV